MKVDVWSLQTFPREVAAVADLHVDNHRMFGGPEVSGINSRCAHITRALDEVYYRMEQRKVSHLFILGDLFDRCKPTPQVVNAVMDVIKRHSPTTILLLGNHDKASSAPLDNALAPLKHVCYVVEKPTLMVPQNGAGQILLIPYMEGPAEQWVEEAITEARVIGKSQSLRGKLLAMTHVGIKDSNTPPWLAQSSDSVSVELINKLLRNEAFVAGNWHEHRLIYGAHGGANTIVQVGALVPTGFDNPSPTRSADPYGSVIFMEWGNGWNVSRRDIIGGPRFHKVPFGMDFGGKKKNIDYVRVVADQEEVAQARQWLQEMVLHKQIADGEVVLNPQDKARTRGEQARAAQSADSADEAIHAFVKKMPMPDDVDAKTVVDRTRQYMKAARKEAS